ncbi:MAG: pimeloyl-ACP methyl ester esterase BioH [Hydrogenophilales bacterium]|nr:pimeloyl-ACP methyl ester esterase BioH [Hydrogenophilales bacterium]
MLHLHVESSGHGPDLALLHGWGMHGGIWEGARDALAERFRVHVVDLPGYGASPACEPYTLEALAHSVARALPERTHVVGWSLGGQVALQWARLAPQQIGKLILIGATPCFRQREDWAHGLTDPAMAEFATGLEQDYEGTLKRFLSLQARSGDEARATISELRAKLFARGRPSLEVLRAGLAILADSDLRQALGAIQQAALVIHGSHDTLTPSAAGQWLAQTLPHAQLELVRGAAHAPFLSHPQATLDAMTRFLHG